VKRVSGWGVVVDLLGLWALEMPALSVFRRRCGRIMACTRWANFDESAVEVDVAGCGAATVEPRNQIAGRCSLRNGILRVGLRSYESGRVHLNSARQAFAKARNC
jgi:hypothetical protein